MKKTTFFFAVMMMTMTAMAQQKVAILETVDKAQNVSYGVKLLLRSCLTSAISNTEGYEGYDRVDMASIAGEQEFQRTGNVSDSQIKQIGRAAGASYVLVAEAAKYDATSIIITAKLLDVETFGVKSSAVVVSGISTDEMKESCETLAAQLLKVPLNRASSSVATTQTQSATNQTASKPIQNQSNNSGVGKKSPLLSGICSFIIPGLGQMYNGEYLKGGLFFGGFIASCVLTEGLGNEIDAGGAIGGIVVVGLWIWNWVDAPTSSKRINAQNGYTFNLGGRTNLGIMPTMNYVNIPLANNATFTSGLKVSLSF